MGIFKYKVLNPVKDAKHPFYDEKRNVLYIPNIKTPYRHYIEAVSFDENKGIAYFLLLGKDRFDINCRLCQTDGYGRVKIKPKGEFKNYIIAECKERGNLKIEYVESADDYDVFSVV